jgi:hypothetical protein
VYRWCFASPAETAPGATAPGRELNPNFADAAGDCELRPTATELRGDLPIYLLNAGSDEQRLDEVEAKL